MNPLIVHVLVLAQQGVAQRGHEAMPIWLPFLSVGIGIALLGWGIYEIKAKRASLGRGIVPFVLRQLGITEITGKMAVIAGYVRCGTGVFAIITGILAPWIAGSLADSPRGVPIDQRKTAARGAAEHAPEPVPLQKSTEELQPRRPTLEADRSATVPEQETSQLSDTEAVAVPSVEPTQSEPSPLTLDEPALPLPPIEYSTAEVRATARLGDEHAENSYLDQAPPNGLLVGMRIAFDPRNGDQIIGVQPIYQVADKYTLGHQLGLAEGRIEQALAKPGFAIGRIDALQGFGIDGIRFEFSRVESNLLSPADAYESKWFGRDQGEPKSLGSGGNFFVGITGSADRAVRSLGLYVVDTFGRRLGAATIKMPGWDMPREPVPVAVTDPRDDETFRDFAQNGGVLVGMRVSQGKDFGGTVQALQPIYQVADQYQLGQWCGTPGDVERVLLAKPEYVIGRINVRAGLVVDAIQVQFIQVRRGRLNPGNVYESEWVGGDGGSLRDVPSEPSLIVGLSGKSERSIESLVYYTAPARAKRSPPRPDRRTDDPTAEPEELRVWTSANGKHTVSATFMRIDGEQVVLKNSKDKEIMVPLKSLSTADQNFVKGRKLRDAKNR
jgi:SLA1 homology domain 1, SHD1